MLNCTIGFITTAVGDRRYHRYAHNLVSDLQRIHPTIPIAVGTDDPESFPGCHTIPIAHISEKRYRSKIETCLKSPFELSVFIDSDSRVLAPVSELFELLELVDIALAFADGREAMQEPIFSFKAQGLPLSSSTIAFRKSRSHGILERWLSEYEDGELFKNRGDQQYLSRLILLHEGLRFAVLPPEYRMNTNLPQTVSGLVRIVTGSAAKSSLSVEELAEMFNGFVGRRALFWRNRTGFWRDFGVRIKLSLRGKGLLSLLFKR